MWSQEQIFCFRDNSAIKGKCIDLSNYTQVDIYIFEQVEKNGVIVLVLAVTSWCSTIFYLIL